ncbi:MAG TPA: glycosyltransferase family 1 protein [Phycisphaerae bacterium]|nr:glycosyltransferase family 1 protein [Phycisphaerae bacterium]
MTPPITGRVLVEDRCLANRGGGIKTYTRQIFNYWPANSPLRLVGFRSRVLNGAADPAHAPPAQAPALRPLSRLFDHAAIPRDPSTGLRLLLRGYQTAFALEARFGRYAAAFHPNHLCPPAHLPTVATMHDLSVLENPDWHTPERVARWERTLPLALRDTRHWITVSAFTRDRMHARLDIPLDRITIIPEAARALPAGPRPANFPERYLLFVGTLEPRKNLLTLFDAFAHLSPAQRRQLPLVLIGPPGWGSEHFWRTLTSHPLAPEILVSGYLPETDVGAALAHASALLLPSLYEGFGLPLLEAMAAACPVICSDIPPFHEVAQDAALMLPPLDVAAWSDAMRRAAEDLPWRHTLIAAGSDRVRQFSWQAAAQRHAELLTRIATENA